MLLKAKSLCLKLHNAALCTDLIDQIHTIQENRLPLTCPEKEFKKFKLINMDYNLLKKQKNNAHSVIIDM